MDPLAFLHRTAKKLKGANHEADQRTAASRSYYAIYHHIKNAFEKEEVHFPPHNHGLLPSCFFQQNLPSEVKAIGKHIQMLYDYRIRADYNLHDSWQKNDSSTAYDLASDLNKTFSSLFSGDVKQSIIEAAKTFLDAKRGYIN